MKSVWLSRKELPVPDMKVPVITTLSELEKVFGENVSAEAALPYQYD